MWNFKGLEDAGRGAVPALVASSAYIAVFAIGIFTLMHGLQNRAFGHWFLLLSAYSIAVSIAFEADPRYHFSLIPFLLIYTAAGMISHIPESLKTFRGGRLSIMKNPKIVYWSASMAIFFLLIGFNLWLKTQEGVL